MARESLCLAAPKNKFCRFSGNTPEAWSVFWALFLIPFLPDVIAPFVMPLPFLFTLFSKRGRDRLKALFLRRRSVIWLSVVYLAVSLLGILPAVSLSGALLTSGLWLFCFLAMLGVAASLRGENDLHLAFSGLIFGVSAVSVIALLQALGFACGFDFWNPFWVPLEEAIIEAIPFLEVDLTFTAQRATATFTNSGVLGFYLVMTLPPCFYLASRAKGAKQTALHLVPLALNATALMMTYSRMSYLTFLFLLLFLLVGYALVHFRKLSKTKRVLAGVAITLSIPLVLCILALVLPESVTARFLSAFKSDNSINARFAIWGKAVPYLFYNEPWRLLTGFGTGVQSTWDTFDTIYRWLFEATGFEVPHAHNIFIQLLMEGGILRLCSFVALIGACIGRCLTVIRQQTDKGKYFLISLAGFFLAILANGLTDYVFVDPKLCFLFFAFIGFLPVLPTVVFPEREG